MARSVSEIQADINQTHSDILTMNQKIDSYQAKLNEYEDDLSILKAQLDCIDQTHDEITRLGASLQSTNEKLSGYACSFLKEFAECSEERVKEELALPLLTCLSIDTRIRARIGVLNAQILLYEEKKQTAQRALELLNTQFSNLCYERTLAQAALL